MFELARPAPTRLALSGSLTIYEVSEARAALLAAFIEGRESSWQLDLSATEEIDSAGAQLLLAARRHLQSGGGALYVDPASAAVQEILDLLRLDELRTGGDHVR